MECPVIHKVTDHNPEMLKAAVANGQKCPITGKGAEEVTQEVQELDINTDEIGQVPSVVEYRKLKKVMAMITKFYRDGSEKKKGNYDSMVENLERLDGDKKMCKEQLETLDSKRVFSVHPKAKEYRTNLQEELENLEKQREQFIAKKEEYFELYEWSKTIVKVCEWLDLVLDDYCDKNLELPESMKKKVKEVPELPKEIASIYFKGLDEITYNLQESQDFFQASVDGRLNKYHGIEKDLIEAQLEVLQKYPEDSPRRMYIENELQKDLEYVKGNMVEDPSGLRRRQKMLKNHAEFCKVLKYYKEKLRHLGLMDYVERTFDTKYDHYN
eukprot:TRINITY_DN685_c0_g1_i2.p1 TRINITY_DN685_c0_g1~~TRINITY_DN685_c0_g1_i2.p1  ORF type:complete len:327 (-),score=76.01 TRINITY_DN685_c0_g1_i2:241-1221(-)